MALDASFAPWQAAIQAKERNRQQLLENIGGLGEGFNQIGQYVQQAKKQQILNQIVQAMRQKGQPIPGPQGYVPPGSGPSAVPAGQPIDNSNLIQSLMMQYDPQSTMQMMPTPLQQSEIAKNNALTKRYGQMGGSGGPGSGKRTIYEKEDGTISLSPVEDATPLVVSDAQAMQYTATPKSSKDKNAAMGARAEAMQRGIDVRQIDQLVSRTGLTPKMQSQLQMNTMRALRSYIPILSRPRITYQELALGEMDLAGIMHGGVPQRDELINTHFPGWQENVSQLKTYALGHPQEIVPPDIQNKVKQMVGDVVKIDNGFLQANKKFSKTMLGPTIRGGLLPQQSSAIDEMVGTLTPPLGESSSTQRKILNGKVYVKQGNQWFEQ